MSARHLLPSPKGKLRGIFILLFLSLRNLVPLGMGTLQIPSPTSRMKLFPPPLFLISLRSRTSEISSNFHFANGKASRTQNNPEDPSIARRIWMNLPHRSHLHISFPPLLSSFLFSTHRPPVLLGSNKERRVCGRPC